MAIRDTMRSSAAPLLHPGEEIQAVANAQTASQVPLMIGAVALALGLALRAAVHPAVVLVFLPIAAASFGAFLVLNRYRILVATPYRLVVMDAGSLTASKARSVVAELPRATQLGPASGGAWYKTTVGGETLRVHRRFFDDIRTMDSLAGRPT
jgi:hypothetical protein